MIEIQAEIHRAADQEEELEQEEDEDLHPDDLGEDGEDVDEDAAEGKNMCSSKTSGAWGGAALIVAVDVSFGAPTVPTSIAFWARVEARPFTEIEQAIWNVD